jgi:hypothetical protein
MENGERLKWLESLAVFLSLRGFGRSHSQVNHSQFLPAALILTGLKPGENEMR